ncbi:MAG: L,D-transpeptidase family protein [Chloroflexi bacterium]|nr:L,D-transpeptidase family protein [Chloroflexota bacterium]
MSTSKSMGSSSDWQQRGRQALARGDQAGARSAFARAVDADPNDVDALLMLASQSDDARESLRHVSQALTLEPRNDAARAALRRYRAQAARDAGRRTAPPAYIIQFSIALCLCMAAISAGAALFLWQSAAPAAAPAPAATETPAPTRAPTATARPSPPPQPSATVNYADRAAALLKELDTAWAQEDWQRAAQLAAQARVFQPADATLKQKVVSAYFNYAVSLLDSGDTTRALWAFDQALEIQPNEPQVVGERTVLVNYIAGIEQYNLRNWAGAAQWLARVYASDAGYLDTRELLYRAYFNQGAALKARNDLNGALKAFQSAVDMDNEAIEARGEAAQLRALLTPPTPTLAPNGPKRIDVNLKIQRMLVYQGQTVVYNWVISTGEPGRPTIPGNFKILDKIPMAYSNIWKLSMPYWMGIYWAGTVENGIHALPILRSGNILWAGFLGRRVSFGCVILDTANSKTLFNWADIGTPVTIHN